ncbi:MAG: ATP-dependent RNA helicase HrpA [Phycisphaeraceae bacterium]|nr:ATP-dependent RNA helicase HrpA [Phycisphaeraceae bacterium]
MPGENALNDNSVRTDDSLPTYEGLRRRVDDCINVDRNHLLSRLNSIRDRSDPRLPVLQDEIERAVAKYEARVARKPVPTFDDSLPVVQRRAEILEAIRRNQVLVLCGETGSGKTTQIPKICLELGRGTRGLIGHTQPRRVAARSVAARIAEELGVKTGGAVGFKMRFADATSPDTYIKLMTDGILLAETQHDRLLDQYDTLIIDEAHERSLNIDFLLGYIKRLIPQRPDLKVIITSATIDPERFAKHFSTGGKPAEIIEVSGRTYPVVVRYRPLSAPSGDEDGPDLDLTEEEAIVAAAKEAVATGPGDILVFLPGEREIRDVADTLRRTLPHDTEILPLYARLSTDEQMRVFRSGNARRRVVLATNVAETSITVPGIRYVIDPGLARVSRYSTRTRVQRLPIEPISQASASQRAGRCGRVGPGVCFRLYEEQDLLKRDQFTEPEILRTNLASVLLQMKALRLGAPEDFPFVEPPDNRAIRDGVETLHELGAFDSSGDLTEIGRKLAKLPIDPRLGRMILAADHEDCVHEALVIASALSIQDPRERPLDKREQADQMHARFKDASSDFKSLLNLWKHYHELNDKLTSSRLRTACRQSFLSFLRLREWSEIYRQLRSLASELKLRFSKSPASGDQVHRAVLAGLLTSVGTKGDNAEYTGCRNIKFFLHPGSALSLSKPQWIMAAELVRTTKLYARCAAKIDPAWIEQFGAHLVKRTYNEPRWKRESGRVIANERVLLHGLEIVAKRPVHFGPIDPKTSREIFIENALVQGDMDTMAPFLAHNLALIEEIRELEAKMRRRDLLAGDRAVFDFYDKRLPSTVCTTHLFEAWRKEMDRREPRLLYLSRKDVIASDIEADPRQYPSEMPVFGSRLPLKYTMDPGAARDGITVDVPLEALHQIDEDRSLWLVPGLLKELVAELLRSLPKAYRHHIVNIPSFAESLAERLTFGQGSLLDTLGGEVRLYTKGLSGDIARSAWRLDAIPAHLRFNYRVIDDSGKELAQSRDLAALKSKFAPVGTRRLPKGGGDRFSRDGIRSWDFGELPAVVQIDRAGINITAYPALVDLTTSCGLRLADSPARAAQLHRAGLCRLYILTASHEFGRLRRGIPDLERLRLMSAPLAKWEEFLNDLMLLAADQTLFESGYEDVRDEVSFDRSVARAEPKLWNAGSAVRKVVGEIVEAHQLLAAKLSTTKSPTFANVLADELDHAPRLVEPGFLLSTPREWLPHTARYLTASRLRLERLPGGGITRDEKLLAELKPWWQLFTGNLHVLAQDGPRRDAFVQFRWMLEELRVSLFAQSLRTAMPISYKRIAQQWEEVMKSGS